MPKRVVIKFGGASLAEPELIAERIRAREREGARVALVVSARAHVTDALNRVLTEPRARAMHRRVVRALARRHPGLGSYGRRELARTEALIHEVELRYPRDRPLGDRLLSQGERLAVHWLAGALAERGLATVPLYTDHLGLITDNAYGASCILFDRSEPAVRRGIGRVWARGRIPLLTGYFGRSLEGRVSTLGRGGSDYTASSIGAMIGADRIELVKRDVSVLSADPRAVPGARAIARLSYEEAEELAQFGARVLHPLTIEPARAHGIEICVSSLNGGPSTTIGPAAGRASVRALTLLAPLRMLRLRVPGGRQRPGIVAEVSQRLANDRVNVVALFTSSALLCLLFDPPETRAAVGALRSLTEEEAAVVDGPFSVALVTAIGDGVLAFADRLPPALLRRAEGLSATPRSLSLAVPERTGASALRRLHRALVEEAAG